MLALAGPGFHLASGLFRVSYSGAQAEGAAIT